MDKFKKEKGWTEANIDSNCDFDKFYNAAEILGKDFNIKFTNKLNKQIIFDKLVKQ